MLSDDRFWVKQYSHKEVPQGFKPLTAPPRFYNTSTLLSYKTTHFFLHTRRDVTTFFPCTDCHCRHCHDDGGRNEKNTVGYRIQVFSDRNQRTAKGEALSKERNIKASFPDMGTYISYDAPSWRLRVGDFRTREEAKVQLDELRELFPGYANEMIIVVDVINTAQ